ncbi:MAG: hypothetical protein FD138_4338, partial [Planctomycetota bacterium]
NGRETAVNSRDQKKTAILQKLNQFRGMLRGLLPQTIYPGAAPLVPQLGLAESKFLAPLDDMASLWGRIDADTTVAGFTPPLLLGILTRAAFITELAGMRTAFAAVALAENDEGIGRKRRDALLPVIRERIVQYRELVAAVLGPTHPLTLSLPVMSPAPGSTPAPVVLSGIWNPTTAQAEFNWPASDNPNLDEYEMRVSSGATYDGTTATVIGNIPAGTTTFATTAGVENPGDQASYKLFVKLTTGNEAGSNTVTITRP